MALLERLTDIGWDLTAADGLEDGRPFLLPTACQSPSIDDSELAAAVNICSCY